MTKPLENRWLKPISQIISESQDPIIKDLTNRDTYICDDCMRGHHEIAGNTTCQCACHNNPACAVCGKILTLAFDIKSRGMHESCEHDLEIMESERRAVEPYGRYPWEL